MAPDIRFKDGPHSSEDIHNILHPAVRQWFFSRFPDFSLPQRYGVLDIHSRRNVLISAPTGATKTLTGFLSILNELVDSSQKGILEDKVYCVYVSPLKALNYDISVNLLTPLREIENILGEQLGIRVAVRTGDTSAAERSGMLKRPPHILITTPESLSIMMTSLKFSRFLSRVDWCIVDEIHALAENKRGVHLSLTLEMLSRLAGHMTRVGLSATISPIEDVAHYLVGRDRPCNVVDVQFLKELDLKVISPLSDLIDAPYEKVHKALYRTMHELVQQHKTTLVFTNTRAATERVVHNLQEAYPSHYQDNIGAHHGSLARDVRRGIEEQLRQGDMKAVVSSTSLELGIDIGHVDLVILLGSPKSVARALQRVGRAGHKLHETAKGRIIVLDRDDLVECSVLLKEALEKNIDSIHIPRNSLDVLAQQIVGIVLAGQIKLDELYELVTRSYCYAGLSYSEFMEVIDYLSGKHASLEERHVYPKIAYYEDTGVVRKRGRLTRVIYMTNIGTIPEEPAVLVKVGDQVVGTLDEAFLERLRKGDVFVLGGQTYQFRHAQGMVAYVSSSVDRPPTVPSWFSEMLPLSFDLARAIARFRRMMKERFAKGVPKGQIISFIHEHLYVSTNAAEAIYDYMLEQHKYLEVPTDRRMVLEVYYDERQHYYIFHTMLGRRVNDCLSRALAYAISRIDQRDVEIGINDNAFYVTSTRRLKVRKALSMLHAEKLELVLKAALDKTEILKRRFRHTASRSFMILRNYKGHSKKVGRQQVSSQILINAVKRISQDFVMLREARREILEDLMDIEHAREVLKQLQEGSIKVQEHVSSYPSPFAFNIILQGFSDVLKAEDRAKFLARMHERVVGKIKEKEGVRIQSPSTENNENLRRELEQLSRSQQSTPQQRRLLQQLHRLEIGQQFKQGLVQLLKGGEPPTAVMEQVQEKQKEILEEWPKELGIYVLKEAQSRFSYEDFWAEEEDQQRLEQEERIAGLRSDFERAAKRARLPADIHHEMARIIEGEKKPRDMSEQTRSWLGELLSGTVPYIWSDRLVSFFRQLLQEA